jgi:hypothetical protein
MQSKRMLLLFVASFALASAAPFLPDAIAHPHLQENRASADAISGDWNIDFHIQGMTTPGTMTLKREGEKNHRHRSFRPHRLRHPEQRFFRGG